MGEHGAICRLGVFYDGSFFSYAQTLLLPRAAAGLASLPRAASLPGEVHRVARAGVC